MPSSAPLLDWLALGIIVTFLLAMLAAIIVAIMVAPGPSGAVLGGLAVSAAVIWAWERMERRGP